MSIKPSFYLTAFQFLDSNRCIFICVDLWLFRVYSEKTEAICSAQRKVREGLQVQRHATGREGWRELKNVYLEKKTLARRHHHHSSSASGMRQWKIPEVRPFAELVENNEGL